MDRWLFCWFIWLSWGCRMQCMRTVYSEQGKKTTTQFLLFLVIVVTSFEVVVVVVVGVPVPTKQSVAVSTFFYSWWRLRLKDKLLKCEKNKKQVKWRWKDDERYDEKKWYDLFLFFKLYFQCYAKYLLILFMSFINLCWSLFVDLKG